MAGALQRLLGHPLTAGVDIDSPEAAAVRARVVREKPFLRQIYEEWYAGIAGRLPVVDGAVLELGSAGGFLDAVLPGTIRSDVIAAADLDARLDSRALPFADGALRAVVMTNVFHHIPDVDRFLAECARCLVPGGRIVMWEPWVTPWSRCVYRYLHHEPFDPDAADWAFPASGPLSAANEALAWIVCARDRDAFERRFETLAIREVRPAMPFCYLASGGIAFRAFLPGAAYPAMRWFERRLSRWADTLAMFALVVVEKSA